MRRPNEAIPLEEIVITRELLRRPSRAPDHESESLALRRLAQHLASSPLTILDEVARTILQFTGTSSSGISVNEGDYFRWEATAGLLAPMRDHRMPREFSPCGLVLERGVEVLMRTPQLHYTYLKDDGVNLEETLLFPFRIGTTITGTIWANSHPGDRQFDAEDLRVLRSLSEFAAAAMQMRHQIEANNDARQKLEKSKQELQEVVAKLEEEREVRERFVATLTHDLRTPLTSAKMNAQLIERNPESSEPAKRHAKRIVGSLDRAESMVRDLLDATQLRAGEALVMQTEEFDLGALAGKTLEELAAVHGPRFSLEADKSVCGHWSLSGLQRILENLCSNGIKYGAEAGLVKVGIRTQGPEVVISVHNDGAPIPPAEQNLIFNQFGRTRSAKAGNQRGWGLGLSLVKGLSKAHGGDVSLESDAEHGTTFFVRMPLDGRLKHQLKE